MATNPAVSLPRAGAVREALEEARAVRRLRERASQRHRRQRRARAAAGRRLGREGRHRHQFRAAHLAPARVPAAAGRGASRTGGSCREVARRLGFGDAFAYRIAADVFREHAALSAFENDGDARFRPRRARGDFGRATSTRSSRSSGRCARAPSDADAALRRRRLLHAGPQGAASSRRSRPRCARRASAAFPLRLNTGRMRDQWHTMTRTGPEPAARRALPEPFVEIHPLDAKAHGLAARRLRPRRAPRTAPACSRS